ncbi:hypothetical protein K438DRAFT_306548 [Mycena galopus ATCC 62051]|nr:hypothetical protein K438DRAFT_306548 [Mycena galopus ATCC 62051]
MGTRGYKFGYFTLADPYCSYPAGLGVDVAQEVPRDSEAYKAWLESLAKSLDELVEEHKTEIDSEFDLGSDYFISKERPFHFLTIEWVYEIDLDHEVFLVDGIPLFALNNMPPSPELCVEWIGIDSYGHFTYHPSTSKEHVYNWKASAPKVGNKVIEDYAAPQRTQKNYSSISELLGTAGGVGVGNCEAVRIALYEAIIGEMMQTWEFGHHIRVLETIPNRTQISKKLLSIGVDVVQVAVGSMLFGKEVKYARSSKGLAFSWLARNICLRITTHLDDERNPKKSILELVDEVAHHRQSGVAVTYGILFFFSTVL